MTSVHVWVNANKMHQLVAAQGDFWGTLGTWGKSKVALSLMNSKDYYV